MEFFGLSAITPQKAEETQEDIASVAMILSSRKGSQFIYKRRRRRSEVLPSFL
jgi:hypothetical protein